MASTANRAKHHVGFGIVVMYKEQTLLLKDLRSNDWVIPGGWLEKDENLHDGVTREILEETNLINCRVHGVVDAYSVDFASPNYSSTKYHGIKKRLITIIFLASSMTKKFQISSEHDSAGWFTEQEILDPSLKLVFPHNRQILVRAFKLYDCLFKSY